MTIENKEMGIRFEVDNQQDFDKWYAIRKEQIRAEVIEEVRQKVKETFKNPSSSWVIAVFDVLIEQLKSQDSRE